MKLSKEQTTYLILGVGAAGLAWWWWRRRQGLPLFPNFSGSGGAPFAGAGGSGGVTGGGVPSVGGTVRIDDPNVIKARSEATGTLARSQCLPTPQNRWINTTTGPYFGKCVPNDVFQLWAALPGDVQAYATDATYFQFMRSIGRA